MKDRFVRLMLLLFCAAATELPAYTFSHTENGVVQRWTNIGPIQYSIYNGGYSKIPDLVSIVQASFNTWQGQNNPLSSKTFSYSTAGNTVNKIGNDGRNIVIFDSKSLKSTGEPFILSQDVGPSTVGLTWRTYYVDTGVIADADIIFNEDYTFTTGVTNLGAKTINLQDVLTHEVGHLLGLNHSFIEHSTMWPYAASGQSTLEDDDKAGTGALYPSTQWANTDSIWGTIKDANNQPVWGVYVSAVREGQNLETVAALSGQTGRYSIRGLQKNTSYRLRARSVELSHLGGYDENGGTSQIFIPEYYPNNASRLTDATPVPSGQGGRDFEMNVATILARYTLNYPTVYVIGFPGGAPFTENYYYAVKFPISSLPSAFTVYGMQFWNNDQGMFWRRIMLCEDSNGRPNIQNVLREVQNYQGKELDFSLVEWETITLTNSKDLWVVFQLPNASSFAVGTGPALGAETAGTFFNSLYYSNNGGSTFNLFPSGVNNYDALVSLTVAETSTPVPVAQFATQSINFGTVRLNQTSVYGLQVSNPGTGDLVITKPINSDRPNYLSAVMSDYRVPSGGVDTIFVRFTPLSTTLHLGQLNILTNSSSGQVNIMVQGRGGYPTAVLSSSSLSFGTVEVGTSASRGFYLKSSGSAPLKATGFAVQPASFTTAHTDTLTVAPGDSALLTVNFKPAAAGTVNGTFTFSLDDSARTAVSVGLSGTGTGGVVTNNCDFTGDGHASLVDVVAFILLSRTSPSDPRLDWNGDGAFSLADVMALIRDIRAETCPQGMLAGHGAKDDEDYLAGLSEQELDYVEEILNELDLHPEERQALDQVLEGVGGPSELPRTYSLAQNYPNPFNPNTAIAFTVPEGAGNTPLSLVVYDLRGQVVRTLVDGVRGPGEHVVYWAGEDESGRAVSSGIYFYRLRAGSQALTRKMVLLK